MIGSLEGTVELLDNPYAIVNVNGVGYRVFLYSLLFAKFQEQKKIKLFIYTHVREDALDLFGFAHFLDLKLFEQLITVSGIGPKTAINIFSFGDRQAIINAIIQGDVAFFSAVPRLGKKNAQKIIIELKNKLGSDTELDLNADEKTDHEDVSLALKSFGFSAKEASDAIKATLDKAKTTEERIRMALKYLNK
ncbi:Holliday junction branch migration protein RuvA [Patescibacteria group bacterium]|nr:Holliday junction branch migration protein RuvA [Patescibacteria group bacterium]